MQMSAADPQDNTNPRGLRGRLGQRVVMRMSNVACTRQAFLQKLKYLARQKGTGTAHAGITPATRFIADVELLRYRQEKLQVGEAFSGRKKTS